MEKETKDIFIFLTQTTPLFAQDDTDEDDDTDEIDEKGSEEVVPSEGDKKKKDDKKGGSRNEKEIEEPSPSRKGAGTRPAGGRKVKGAKTGK